MTAPQDWPAKGLRQARAEQCSRHYAEAARLLGCAEHVATTTGSSADRFAAQANFLAAAQVHATLALYRPDEGGQQ